MLKHIKINLFNLELIFLLKIINKVNIKNRKAISCLIGILDPPDKKGNCDIKKNAEIKAKTPIVYFFKYR